MASLAQYQRIKDDLTRGRCANLASMAVARLGIIGWEPDTQVVLNHSFSVADASRLIDALKNADTATVVDLFRKYDIGPAVYATTWCEARKERLKEIAERAANPSM